MDPFPWWVSLQWDSTSVVWLMVERSINTNLEGNCAPIPSIQAMTFLVGLILSSTTFRILLTQENAALLSGHLTHL